MNSVFVDHFILSHLLPKYCNLLLRSTCAFLVSFVFKSIQHDIGILAEGSRTELVVLGVVSDKSYISMVVGVLAPIVSFGTFFVSVVLCMFVYSYLK